MADNDWREFQGTDEDEDEDLPREELRDLLAMFGYELPISMADVEALALELTQTIRNYEDLAGQGWPTEGAFMSGVRQKIAELAQQFGVYATEKFGTEALGRSRAFTIFSELIRPARPAIEKRPTAEEFLSDFDRAYTLRVEGMRSAGEISGAEAEFAYNVLRTQRFREYTAALGKFAEAGASPFALTEVTKEERGVAPGTTAGKALQAAVGPGVTEPTRIHEEIGAEAAPEAAVGAGAAEQVERRQVELREQVEDIGVGVAREFITTPRIMPGAFLEETLSAENIRLAFAGSPEGGGRGTRPAPAGFTSAVRRV